MKKVFLAILLLTAIHSSYSQSKKVLINKCTNKVEVQGPNGVICSNVYRTKWFTLIPAYKLDGNRLSSTGFTVIRSGLGTLSKKDQLFFSFKDGTKLRLELGGELKSDNIVYFELSELEFSLIKAKAIKSVRYINGNDYKSLEYIMVGNKERNYYTNLFNNYQIQEVHCDK
jgi:hypothetical protein